MESSSEARYAIRKIADSRRLAKIFLTHETERFRTPDPAILEQYDLLLKALDEYVSTTHDPNQATTDLC